MTNISLCSFCIQKGLMWTDPMQLKNVLRKINILPNVFIRILLSPAPIKTKLGDYNLTVKKHILGL